MTSDSHAFTCFPDQHRDVDADRADHGAASAQRTAVIDQRFPIGEILVREGTGKAQCLAEFTPEGVFLFPDLAQRFEFVDGCVLRISRFGKEQAGNRQE